MQQGSLKKEINLQDVFVIQPARSEKSPIFQTVPIVFDVVKRTLLQFVGVVYRMSFLMTSSATYTNFELTSQAWSATHASSHLFSWRKAGPKGVAEITRSYPRVNYDHAVSSKSEWNSCFGFK